MGCQWKLFIEDTSRNPAKLTDEFYVKNINGDLIPDEDIIIKVYFEPHKNVTELHSEGRNYNSSNTDQNNFRLG